MTVINTNVGALVARTYAIQADNASRTSMERLSSGLRINSAADDAAGLAVANKMEAQLRGLNMAIRNSQDGISLVQTAEAGMSEITNMVVRLRELAVQMNNGVYTESDRSNAELEVSALLAEIDRIADNTAFNQVKVLDGSYNKDIRAGNTNPEVIGVAIDRMNTDSLGGNQVETLVAEATKAATNPNTAVTSKTVVSAEESNSVTIAVSELSPEFDSATAGRFANTYAGGVFSLSGTDSALFSIDATTGAITSAAGLDFEAPTDADGDNVYKFDVVYTRGTNVFTDSVELNVTDWTPTTSTVAEADATVLTTAETDSLTLKTTGASGILSNRFQEMAQNDMTGAAYNGAFTLTAHSTDAGDVAKFQISNTGVITLDPATSRLDFENPADVGTDNSYKFNVVYTDSRGEVFTEAVVLNVTDSTADAGLAWNTTLGTETASAGLSNISLAVDTTDQAAAKVFDLTAAGNQSLLSADAQAFIGLGAFTATATVAGAPTGYSVAASAAATLFSIDGRAVGFATGTETVTVTITNTATSDTFTEVLRITTTDADSGAGDQTGANYTSTAGAADLATNSTTTFTGGTSGGDAVAVDMSANNASFVDLHAFRTEFSGGTYALTAGSADFDFDTTTNELSLKAGKVGGTYTATVTYTQGSNVFTQNLSVTTTTVGTLASATATATQASNTETSAASQDSTVATSAKSSLLIDEARQGTIQSVGVGRVLSEGFNSFVDNNDGGTFTLEGTDAAMFNIEKNSGKITSNAIVDFENQDAYDITVRYTSDGGSYVEEVAVTVTDSTDDEGTHLDDLDFSTQDGAAAAVLILDEALEQLSSSQAKLGAIQNRLQHNIDNLSTGSMLTEQARGRIVDADFASETSNLSKQQILGQAATAMLAQANQSKQSVLSLLQ